jgi:tol-pal system protein YbgF
MGCATTYDLQRGQQKLDLDIQSLKEENASIRKNIEKVNEAIANLTKMLADIKKDNIQTMKGRQELLQEDVSTLTAKDGGCKDIKKKIDQISNKVDFIEDFLDIAKNQNQSERDEKGIKIDSKNVLTDKMVEKSVYELAYETFKKGKYDKARIRFQRFLKQYPNTAYSDDAVFWIGECYYLEQKYKEAILEYEKVVKNYPKGNKVPSALLMQGLSFLKLNNKPSAELILQRVIQKYPNTNQARIAREKLIECN